MFVVSYNLPLVEILTVIVGLIAVYVSTESIKNARKAFAIQQFESTFFNLLTTHRSILSEMDIQENETKQPIRRGRDCFRSFYKALKTAILTDKTNLYIKNNSYSENAINKMPIEFDRILWLYEKEVFHSFKGDLSHYFRTLYHTVKFIDESEAVNDSKKREYLGILRAQLSTYELILLYYNCLSSYGRVKFKPLIDKYDLLSNLDKSLILEKETLGNRMPNQFFLFETEAATTPTVSSEKSYWRKFVPCYIVLN